MLRSPDLPQGEGLHMMHEHRNHLFPSCDPQTSVTLAPVNSMVRPSLASEGVPTPSTDAGHSSQSGHRAAWDTGFIGGGGGVWLQSAPWDSGLRGQLWRVSVLGTLPAPPPTCSSCSHEPEGLGAGLGHLSASMSFLRWAII